MLFLFMATFHSNKGLNAERADTKLFYFVQETRMLNSNIFLLVKVACTGALVNHTIPASCLF